MQALSKFLLGAFFVGFPLYPFKIVPGQKRDLPCQMMDLETDVSGCKGWWRLGTGVWPEVDFSVYWRAQPCLEVRGWER